MFARQFGFRAVQGLTLVGVTAILGGCAAKVKKKDYLNDMAQLRQEISNSDHQLATRVDSTNQQLGQTNQQVADHTRRLAALEQEFQAFRQEYKVGMEKMKTMLKFDVPVHFAFDKAEVRDSDKVVLDRFAAVVKEYYPGALITVEGFTDAAGSTAYNMRLGQRRADSVKAYLMTAGGFDDVHIKSVSYGKSRNRQVVPGAHGPEKGLENRRVALVIDHELVATDKVSMH